VKVDSDEKISTVLASLLGGAPCTSFNHVDSTAPAVPLLHDPSQTDQGDCYPSSPSRDATTYACDTKPADQADSHQKRRLCYCSSL
jgi:hypothetical protein